MDVRPDPNPEFAELASEARVTAVLAALNRNGIPAEVVADGAAAKERVVSLLKPGAVVFTSLSQTLAETGIAAEINETGRYDAIRPKLAKLDRATQRREMKKLAATPDVVVGSFHAITEDGSIMSASGTGSQLSHYVYEADKVVLVGGIQKLVKDEREGLRRIEEYCLPLENMRMMRLMGSPSSLSKILTVRRDFPAGRTTVILIREKLGF